MTTRRKARHEEDPGAIRADLDEALCGWWDKHNIRPAMAIAAVLDVVVAMFREFGGTKSDFQRIAAECWEDQEKACPHHFEDGRSTKAGQ